MRSCVIILAYRIRAHAMRSNTRRESSCSASWRRRSTPCSTSWSLCHASWPSSTCWRRPRAPARALWRSPRWRACELPRPCPCPCRATAAAASSAAWALRRRPRRRRAVRRRDLRRAVVAPLAGAVHVVAKAPASVLLRVESVLLVLGVGGDKVLVPQLGGVVPAQVDERWPQPRLFLAVPRLARREGVLVDVDPFVL